MIYPNYSKKGLKGNVNVASFMYDYVNFGLLGLVLSGVLLSVVLILEKLFIEDLIMKLVINIVPVLILSSQAFLFSFLVAGGLLA